MSGTMTVGVISRGGSYTGRPEFADLARSQYRTAGAEIRAPIGAKAPRGDGGSDRATTPAAQPSVPTVTPISQASSMGDDAARRAMMSTAAAGRKRRTLLD